MENQFSRPEATSPGSYGSSRVYQNDEEQLNVRKIVVINGKGGCGKTTVATNLATWYAGRGFNPALFDHDPQTSSMRWLRVRPTDQPSVHGVSVQTRQKLGVTRSWHLRVPPDTQRIINDTPAGLAGLDIADHVQGADCILIPVLPSAIDIEAGADFIRDLLLMGRVRTAGIRVGIIANRIKSRTVALQALERFLHSLRIPVVARFRDSQHYVHAAEQGLGIGELARSRSIELEIEQWNRLYQWVESMPVIKAPAHGQ
ncbi:MAG: ParA family protein [Aquisalimonadaceae bacterium]